MIEINILRERQKRHYQRKTLGRLTFAYFLGLAFLAFVLGVIYLGDRFVLNDVTDDILRLNDKIKNEKVLMERVGEYQGKMESFNKKLTVCQAELAKRTLWTNKVALIGDSVPSGVWLTKIMQGETATEKGKVAVFIVAGAVASGRVNERAALTAFMDRLEKKTKDEFGGGISLKEIKRTGQGEAGDSVAFIVECRLKKANESEQEKDQ